MAVPREGIELIERFQDNHDTYHSCDCNETEIRCEFDDPFFKALGWDINNNLGYAEAYKDGMYEDAIKIGRLAAALDHAVRISFLDPGSTNGMHYATIAGKPCFC